MVSTKRASQKMVVAFSVLQSTNQKSKTPPGLRRTSWTLLVRLTLMVGGATFSGSGFRICFGENLVDEVFVLLSRFIG